MNPYLRTQILTAGAEELRLMLFDGALKFARQARQALEERNFEDSYHHLVRAKKIVLELSTGMNHEVDPQLCERLSALYTYIYRLLVEANMSREPVHLDEAIELLDYERETWQQLLEKTSETEREEGAASSTDAARQTAMSSYSA